MRFDKFEFYRQDMNADKTKKKQSERHRKKGADPEKCRS